LDPIPPDDDIRHLAYDELLSSGGTLMVKASTGLAQDGLTITPFRVLNMLRVRGPQPQKEVAKYIWRSVSTAGVLAASLERKGLVERQGDVSDGRLVILSLTPRGVELMERAVPKHVAQIRGVMSRLTEAECELLIRLMAKLAPEE
jgi:DNA-binding MarR family transcriptional regulator